MNIAEGRPAKQSSTTGKAVGLYAVDGNVDGLGVYGECSVTRESSNPWWKVDLGKTYRVDNVVVIIGTKHTAPTLSHNGVGVNINFDTNSLLRERELTTNLAIKKYATLWPSSNYPYRSSFAVDGKLDGGCTRVNKHRNAWWHVDLIDVYEIWAVVIYRCSVTGNIVRVVHGDPKRMLQLREVLVFGSYVKPGADMTANLARGKRTLQSSTYKEGHSWKAVDGKKTTNPRLREKRCSFTSPARDRSWWQVDLEYIYEIIQVVITNGGVSLRYTVIETLLKNATNVTICNTIDPPLKWNETRQIPCQRDAVGSIVRIRQQAAVPGTLALCEVEVYGTFESLRRTSTLAAVILSASIERSLGGTRQCQHRKVAGGNPSVPALKGRWRETLSASIESASTERSPEGTPQCQHRKVAGGNPSVPALKGRWREPLSASIERSLEGTPQCQHRKVAGGNPSVPALKGRWREPLSASIERSLEGTPQCQHRKVAGGNPSVPA
ncbi:hypothetical protein NP493_600g04021 [Ridgeia piscesae]|uniref:Fucolectin tachylectin-4 pentraxin-1 domain-containing protein n=1 Tax=Ridgeia piscesae TaxID=27915 RepID=A0AAD9NS39_RIDPI|nr:hypothetical protein NP493_600g04021 [Ridgeia piscesae]